MPVPPAEASSPPTSRSPSAEATKHSKICKRALYNTYVSAARMSEFYNRRKRIEVQEFSVGDRVSVAVPKLDRTATDLPRIPAEIIAIHGPKVKSHSLTTAFGTISTKFTGGDL